MYYTDHSMFHNTYIHIDLAGSMGTFSAESYVDIYTYIYVDL